MVGCRSSRLNLDKPFSGPVSTLMSSSAEFYSFSLSGRLRAVGLNALTRLSAVIYMNCAIKSLYLLRQCDVDNLVNCAIKSLYLLGRCDVDNLVNKQFYFQTECSLYPVPCWTLQSHFVSPKCSCCFLSCLPLDNYVAKNGF